MTTAPATRLERDVLVASLESRGRLWEASTHRDLAQLGLTPFQAQRCIDDYSPPGMDLTLYFRAMDVVRTRRRSRADMAAGPVDDGAGVEDLVQAYARRVVIEGRDPVLERATLAVDLVRRGHAEIWFPAHRDPTLWEAAGSGRPQALTDYMLGLEPMGLPSVDWERL